MLCRSTLQAYADAAVWRCMQAYVTGTTVSQSPAVMGCAAAHSSAGCRFAQDRKQQLQRHTLRTAQRMHVRYCAAARYPEMT